MYSAGLKGPTGEGRTELIGNLSLVGVKGNFCAVLSERELTLERIDGKGIRLNLASINATRALKIPYLPNGLIPLGLISIALGITAMTIPYGIIPVMFGILVISMNLYSRYSILSIETNSGDRHLIAGSEGVLLRLTLMISRLMHGSDIKEARLGLENLENEIPTYPSFTYAGGITIKSSKGLLNSVQLEEKNSMPSDEFSSNYSLSDTIVKKTVNSEYPNNNLDIISYDDDKSAYEGAWGGRTPPPWYSEKEQKTDEDNRIDSALSDAVGHMDMFGGNIDMFGEGGLLDHAPSIETNSDNLNLPQEDNELALSSAKLLKKAFKSHGEPNEGYENLYNLPKPTEIAVREECRSGVVRQAKAIQELKSKRDELNYVPKTSNLEEFPALRNLAYNLGESRFKVKGVNYQNKKFGWIDRILRPPITSGRKPSSQNSHDDIPGKNAKVRFQTSQHLRLRSDQEHQSNVGKLTMRSPRTNSNDSARKALNVISARISNDEKRLRFNQLRSTNSVSENHILPGIKKLL
jgi:hypothetical protein